jgi:hypothetical protein
MDPAAKRRVSLFVAALLLVLLSAPRTVTADSFTIDQANDFVPNFLNPFGLGIVVKFNSPIGQEFIPAFSSLDIVELKIDLVFTDHADFLVNIRAGTITGPIVGTSGIVQPKNTHLWGWTLISAVSIFQPW